MVARALNMKLPRLDGPVAPRLVPIFPKLSTLEAIGVPKANPRIPLRRARGEPKDQHNQTQDHQTKTTFISNKEHAEPATQHSPIEA